MDVHQRRLQHNRGALHAGAMGWRWLRLTRLQVAGYSTSFDVSAAGRGSFEFITVRADAL
jgi:hypothetical protein